MLFGKSTPAILAIIYLYLNCYTILTLAHLELRVLLADDIKASFTLDDLAILAALFDGSFDFHYSNDLFVPEKYSSLC